MICPYCHHEVLRAKMGKGTFKGLGMKLNENRNLILAIFRQQKKPLTIRDIQQIIFDKGVKRESSRNVGWNYHTIQADVSILLGGRYLKMLEHYQTEQDNESYFTNKVPEYTLV